MFGHTHHIPGHEMMGYIHSGNYKEFFKTIEKLPIEDQCEKLNLMLHFLLDKLIQSNIKEINKTISKALLVRFVMEILNKFYELTREWTPNPTAISKIIYQAGCILAEVVGDDVGLSGKITNEIFLKMLTDMLKDKNTNSISIEKTFQGIALICKVGMVKGQLPASVFCQLLQLLENKGNEEAFTKAVYWLALACSSKSVIGEVPLSMLNNYLRLMDKKNDASSVEIASALQTVGRMYRYMLVKGEIEEVRFTSLIHQLIKKLEDTKSEIGNQEIAETLFAIAMIPIRPPINLVRELREKFSCEEKTIISGHAALVVQASVLLADERPPFFQQYLRMRSYYTPNNEETILLHFRNHKYITDIQNGILVGAWRVNLFIDLLDGQVIIVRLDNAHQYHQGVLRQEYKRQDDWMKERGYQVLRFSQNAPDFSIKKVIQEIRQKISDNFSKISVNTSKETENKTECSTTFTF